MIWPPPFIIAYYIAYAWCLGCGIGALVMIYFMVKHFIKKYTGFTSIIPSELSEQSRYV